MAPLPSKALLFVRLLIAQWVDLPRPTMRTFARLRAPADVPAVSARKRRLALPIMRARTTRSVIMIIPEDPPDALRDAIVVKSRRNASAKSPKSGAVAPPRHKALLFERARSLSGPLLSRHARHASVTFALPTEKRPSWARGLLSSLLSTQ